MNNEKDIHMLNAGFSYDESLQKYYDNDGIFLWNIMLHFDVKPMKDRSLLKLGFVKISKENLENITELKDNLLQKDYIWIRKDDLKELKLLANNNHQLIIKYPNPNWIQSTIIYSVYSQNYLDVIQKQPQKKLK